MSVALGILTPVLALASLAFAFYFWRQQQKLQYVLRDAHARLQAGRAGYDQLQEEHNKTAACLQTAQEMLQEMESIAHDAREKSASLAAAHEVESNEKGEKLRALSLQLEHLREENQALKEQLRDWDEEAAHEKRRLQSELQSQIDSLKAQLRKHTETGEQGATAWREKLRESHRQREQLAQRVDRMKQVLQKINPDDYHRSKAKIKQLEQLYLSMKGLRELAEERNRNWEFALRQLSSHILKMPFDARAPIGEVVSRALESFGSQLVEDSLEDEKALWTPSSSSAKAKKLKPRPASSEGQAST